MARLEGDPGGDTTKRLAAVCWRSSPRRSRCTSHRPSTSKPQAPPAPRPSRARGSRTPRSWRQRGRDPSPGRRLAGGSAKRSPRAPRSARERCAGTAAPPRRRFRSPPPRPGRPRRTTRTAAWRTRSTSCEAVPAERSASNAALSSPPWPPDAAPSTGFPPEPRPAAMSAPGSHHARAPAPGPRLLRVRHPATSQSDAAPRAARVGGRSTRADCRGGVVRSCAGDFAGRAGVGGDPDVVRVGSAC